MTMDPLPTVASGKAWRALAAATVAVFALGVWRSATPSIVAASAQEGRSVAGGDAPSTSSAHRSAAVALARLLPASGLISVGARPGVRVVELKVKEDDQVAAGTVLAILEGHEAARLQLRLAEAQKRRSEHERRVRIAAARKATEITKRRLDEGRTLYSQFGPALKGKDRYDAEMAMYQVEMQAIKTQLDLDLAQGTAPAAGGGNPAEPSPARAESAEDVMLAAQVETATAALHETEVRAPGPGRVLRVIAHPGELSSGVLLMMGDVSSMVAKAEVYQTDVPRIRPGDPAEVDILGTRIAGRVARIGSIVGKNQLMSIDPRAMRDLRVIEVTIQLDQAAPADRFVDMEVEAVIRTPVSTAGSERGGTGGTGRSPG